MAIFLAFLLFLLMLVVYMVIAEIFTFMFRLTGLTEEKARFQVFSLLTNSGFTTAESEAVVANKQRRRLARRTMLFGYAFTVTIVSAVVNIVLAVHQSELENILGLLPIPFLVLTVIVIFRKNGHIKHWLSGKIESLANHLLYKGQSNGVLLMDTFGQKDVAQVHIQDLPEPLRNIPLKDAGLRNRGILVLMRQKPGEEPQEVDGETVLENGDTLVVLGQLSAIREVFHASSEAD